jgi:uncharacterized protein YyaL (SSP411 family)
VVIIGEKTDPTRNDLLKSGLSTYKPGLMVNVFDPDSKVEPPYPPDPDGKTVAYVCTGKVCSAPTGDPARVAALIKTQKG